MANIKQQAKRNLTNEKRRLQNASFKSALKTAIKNVETAVENKNLEEAKKAYQLASAKLDKSICKGLSHKNFVARNKSRLSKLVNTLA
jgi:small subunit ribosomal protein S20